MGVMFKPYASLGYALFGVLAGSSVAQSQETAGGGGARPTCAALLSDGPALSSQSPTPRVPSDSAGARSAGASASVGGAQAGAADIFLRVSAQANEVRFASQPQVRVRLCWGGDTLTVVARENLPTPVVAGATYRNVYVAVELLGRLNAECLSDRITGRTVSGASAPSDSATTPSSCAFLGVSGAAGQQQTRPQVP
jgi:hypothetical protein